MAKQKPYSLVNVYPSGYFVVPNHGLKNYFTRVRLGQPEEYRTTFAKNENLADVLDDWDRELQSLADTWPSLYEYETAMREKVGPMSIMKPLVERMDDIEHYYLDVTLHAKSLDQQDLDSVVNEWSVSKPLTLFSRTSTWDQMRKNTNAGNPSFAKRNRVGNKILNSELTDYVEDLGFTKVYWDHDEFGICAVLGWRGQEGGIEPDDVKQRVVWMFPASVNLEELRLYYPLVQYAQTNELVPAWHSMELVDTCITRMFDTKDKADLVMCTDFTRFDQHFNSKLQDGARYILAQLFHGRDENNWLKEVFPIKYVIPLMYDYGKLITGLHGMGSGSGGTNADETLVHRALQYEAARAQGSRLNKFSQCLGDDGVLTYPGLDPDLLVKSYSSHGLEMNPDKQDLSDVECTYLRRWHHIKYRRDGICVGVYSTNRAIGRLCEQERFYAPKDWGPKMVALRQLSILENCKFHPMAVQFVKWCMKRDKYRLGIDIPGFLDNIDLEAKEATAHMPDFLGYTKSEMLDSRGGISRWWIVKTLKSLS
uniref:RNA-dependent RNA polymerase n=1 Tax=Bovine picobirnavirus TaxID=1977295 RepID=A0A4Y1KCX0_9VIRU|nr:RNA-dependent RNA polymerase [Bovine picobirnavirus]